MERGLIDNSVFFLLIFIILFLSLGFLLPSIIIFVNLGLLSLLIGLIYGCRLFMSMQVKLMDLMIVILVSLGPVVPGLLWLILTTQILFLIIIIL